MCKIHLHLFRFASLAALMNCSFPVFSEPACMKNVQNEEEINICQHTEAKQLELELNDLEHSIRSRFKSPQIERFDEAQTRWQQMTEKDCEIEAFFYEGATIYPAIQSECLQRHYLDRMETLKKYVCPEPNLGSGCVVPDQKPDDSTPNNPVNSNSSKRFR